MVFFSFYLKITASEWFWHLTLLWRDELAPTLCLTVTHLGSVVTTVVLHSENCGWAPNPTKCPFLHNVSLDYQGNHGSCKVKDLLGIKCKSSCCIACCVGDSWAFSPGE